MGVFSYEDKIVIKYLRQKFKHGAIKIVTDHPEKEWKTSAVNRLLKKIDQTGEIARKKGSGRPRTICTDQNIEDVQELICSQEDNPGRD